jgi:hypothetical protein
MDTLLHAAHATNQGYSAIKKFSEENDDFIIAASMFMNSGNKTLTKLADLRRVLQAYVLLYTMHSLGCTLLAYAMQYLLVKLRHVH